MLTTTKKVMTWFSMYPVEETISRRKKVTYIIFSLISFAISISGMTGYLTFTWTFKYVDLGHSLYAFMGASALVPTIYISVFTFFKQHKIKMIFDELEKIYDVSRYHDK